MRNRPYGFEIYLVNVKTMKTLAQIFLAFSEKLNFKQASKSKSKLVISSEATPWCLIYFMSGQGCGDSQRSSNTMKAYKNE